MKLVEILARELKEWPKGAQEVTQWERKLELTCEKGKSLGISLTDLADDYVSSYVTSAQWEAERARILAESSKFTEQDKEHIADLTAIACGKRSKEDQELWDNVAISSITSILSIEYDRGCGYKELASECFEFADAFMAERAKRMKG